MSVSNTLSKIRRLGPFGLLAGFMVGGPLLGAVVLVATRERWLPPLEALDPSEAALWFAVGTVLLAGLSLTPTHASSLVAGMLFGAVHGAWVAVGAIAAAGVFAYALLRPLTTTHALAALERWPRARVIHRALLERRARLTLLILLIRLSPVMPFAATNLLLAAGGVRPVEFVVGSVVGLAPRIVAVVVAGAGLSELDLGQAADVRVAVVGGVATVLVLIAISAIARRALEEAAAE